LKPDNILFHTTDKDYINCKFSIIIPTWNNLGMLKLCVESIRKHSSYHHQIVLHINGSEDGTLEWADSQNIDYSYSVENVGICFGINSAASLARTKYIAYLNDDMYVLPDWDYHLLTEIDSRDDDMFFLSGTAIEPRKTRSNLCSIAPHSFGQSVDTFQQKDLLDQYEDLPKEDWSGATWPPNIVSRRLWNLVGGYSVEFSPGMYSDPDFSMKLWHAGVRYYKGIAASRVYHFMSRSTGRIKKNDGSKSFLHKWGITSSTFVRYYLHRGEDFFGELAEPERNLKLRILQIKARLKIILNLS